MAWNVGQKLTTILPTPRGDGDGKFIDLLGTSFSQKKRLAPDWMSGINVCMMVLVPLVATSVAKPVLQNKRYELAVKDIKAKAKERVQEMTVIEKKSSAKRISGSFTKRSSDPPDKVKLLIWKAMEVEEEQRRDAETKSTKRLSGSKNLEIRLESRTKSTAEGGLQKKEGTTKGKKLLVGTKNGEKVQTDLKTPSELERERKEALSLVIDTLNVDEFLAERCHKHTWRDQPVVILTIRACNTPPVHYVRLVMSGLLKKEVSFVEKEYWARRELGAGLWEYLSDEARRDAVKGDVWKGGKHMKRWRKKYVSSKPNGSKVFKFWHWLVG